MTKLFSTPSSRRAVLGGAVGAVGVGALGASPSSAMAAARMAATNYSYNRLYLTVAGITGDSTSEAFPGAIELMDCEFGTESEASFVKGGGAAAGKSAATPFSFSCVGGKASPKLFLASAQGKRIGSATLNATGALHEGGEDVNYLTVKFEPVFITKYDVADSELPAERISMVYQKITYTYRYENESGTPTPVTITWDFAKQTTS